MNFKCKVENGSGKTFVIKNVEPECTIENLKTKIAEEGAIKSVVQILSGFPPAPIQFEPTDQVSAKFKGNDLLLIQVEEPKPSKKTTSNKKNNNTGKKNYGKREKEHDQ
jgi:hypothetical protein